MKIIKQSNKSHTRLMDTSLTPKMPSMKNSLITCTFSL